MGAWCELCDMEQVFCSHGLAERRKAVAAHVPRLLISRSNIAHFPGCPHKGDDVDFRGWGELTAPRAWERLGNGERLQATGGDRPDRVAQSRCEQCIAHGPWL